MIFMIFKITNTKVVIQQFYDDKIKSSSKHINNELYVIWFKPSPKEVDDRLSKLFWGVQGEEKR